MWSGRSAADGNHAFPSFVFMVIGGAGCETGAGHLGGVVSTLEKEGAQGSVRPGSKIVITALQEAKSPNYAHPALR